MFDKHHDEKMQAEARRRIEKQIRDSRSCFAAGDLVGCVANRILAEVSAKEFVNAPQ